MNAVTRLAEGSPPPVSATEPALPAGLPAWPKRPASLRVRAALAAVNVAAVAFFLLAFSRHGVSFGSCAAWRGLAEDRSGRSPG